MKTKKEFIVLSELLQMGYDFNTIRNYGSKLSQDYTQVIDVNTPRLIEYIENYFATCGTEYPTNTKENTYLRFCITFGIGVAWLLAQDNNNNDPDILYNKLTEHRGVFEMDEYIEDLVGIWFSGESYTHSQFLKHCDRCADIIRRYYNLTSKEEIVIACKVMMEYGLHMGATNVSNKFIVKVDNNNSCNLWGGDVWEYLIDCDESLFKNRLYEEIFKAINEAESVDNYFVTLLKDHPKDTDTFVYETRQFSVYNNGDYPGIKCVLNTGGDNNELISSFPVFNTTRRYVLKIEEVKVLESGAEALITAHFDNDEDNRITFYDVSYLENKDLYYAGEYYQFDLYGVALNVKPVPENEQEFSFTGQKAIDFNTKIGNETEYDDKGNPKPVIFNTKRMHAFLQIDEKFPQIADIHSPIAAVLGTSKVVDCDYEEVEIEVAYRNNDSDSFHPLSVFIPKSNKYEFGKIPTKGMPVRGSVILTGRMLERIQTNERPSTVLHSFDLKDESGNKIVFTNDCVEDCKGTEMTEVERYKFAKKIIKDYLNDTITENSGDNGPDYWGGRFRALWVVADDRYSAEDMFLNGDHTDKIILHYRTRRRPVIAYVTLYDADDNECKWINGDSYTARIYYGSVLPGQKMKHTKILDHNGLVEKLFESYAYHDTGIVKNYLHKDLDYRSCNMKDPVITRDEYIWRSNDVNKYIAKQDKSYFKPVLVVDHDGKAYIEMKYSSSTDILRIEEKYGLITKIEITSNKDNLEG